MSYVQKVLLPDEHVICGATLHWILYVRGLGITIFGGIFGFYSHEILEYLFGTGIADQFMRPLSAFAMVIVLVGTLFLFAAYMRQSSTEIVVTNHRLIAKYGIISRVTYEIMVSRITGANFDQTVMGRMFNFGTIWVHGAGGEVSPIAFVYNPQLFYRALITVLERFQVRRPA